MVKSKLVWAVEHEDHGIIGVVDSAISAAHMLISCDWVSFGTDIWCAHEKTWFSLKEVMDRLGYLNDDAFVADMLEGKCEGYEWDFVYRTVAFYEEA